MNGLSKEFEKRLFVISYPLTIFWLKQQGISQSLVQELEQQFPNLRLAPVYTKAVAKVNGTMFAVLFGIDLAKKLQSISVFPRLCRLLLADFMDEKLLTNGWQVFE